MLLRGDYQYLLAQRVSVGVVVVSGDVLLRLEKSNASGRSHEFMNVNEKRNNRLSVDGLCGRKHFLPGCFSLLWKRVI